MTATLFIGFTAVMTIVFAALVTYYLPRRTGFAALAGLLGWLLYVGLIGYSGVIRDAALRPPGISFIALPVFLFVVFLARSSAGASLALELPIWVILGAQSFRTGVEIFLHQLWIEGLAPRMLTFEASNFDILIGVSAPLFAWLSTKGRQGMRLAFVWSALGLLSLANVVVRSALTAPGPLNVIHLEVPNLVVGTFPFTFIPGFFAPLAASLHVLAIRALRRRLSVDRLASAAMPA